MDKLPTPGLARFPRFYSCIQLMHLNAIQNDLTADPENPRSLPHREYETRRKRYIDTRKDVEEMTDDLDPAPEVVESFFNMYESGVLKHIPLAKSSRSSSRQSVRKSMTHWRCIMVVL